MQLILGLTTALAAATLAFSSVSGCSSRKFPSVRNCNPLGGGAGEDCLLPFPSTYFTRSDPATPTGIRVQLDKTSLPETRFGVPLDPTRYNQRDGFSAITPLLAQFPNRIAPGSLPPPERPQTSLRSDSPIQLIRFDTMERVPVFAELDANVDPASGELQALIIHPVVRLRPKTRYVAVIQGLRTPAGADLPPLSGFGQLRDGKVPLDSTLQGEKARFDGIFQMLDRSGIKRHALQLAWDFTTGSDESTIGRMVRMRNLAFRESELAREPVTIKQVEDDPSRLPELRRRVLATFQVASFLVGGNGDRLNTDSEGNPGIDRPERFPLTIHIPKCAESAQGPLPVLIYGHGTFNSARNEMANPHSRSTLNRLCMVEIGTDWLGRAKDDLLYFLVKILPNWNNFAQITDRLQQAHLNVATLAHLVRTGALDRLPALMLNGKAVIDRRRIYYYGISEGGCQGTTTLALSPDIDRGAMNVPCGFWSMFFWRSSDFQYPRRLMQVSYPSPIDQQKLIALSQLLWDYTDPAHYGAHVLRDPLPGNHPKRILYQEGINDASVPNVTTRAMVRTIGLKLLQPRVEPVEGVTEIQGPADSAYVQFDVGNRPRLGANNIPPSVSSVHEDIRRLDAAQEQLARFLRADGKVEDTCGGKPCVFAPLRVSGGM